MNVRFIYPPEATDGDGDGAVGAAVVTHPPPPPPRAVKLLNVVDPPLDPTTDSVAFDPCDPPPLITIEYGAAGTG
jgi:hypothetical protein